MKRYLAEEKKPDWKLRLMIAMCDGLWLYTRKEERQWHQIFPHTPMVALQNTLTGVEEMLGCDLDGAKQELKHKYHIGQEIVFIFCARFESNYRRVDLLLETIKRLDSSRFGFIIIGAGANKPDFSAYPNVYDFGAVYDTDVKRELFAAADVYFQPGWVGLSIVEAMAYGKPVCTFCRSEQTLQCVEYSYIEPLGQSSKPNGMVFSNIDECVAAFERIDAAVVTELGNNARSYVRENLMIDNMVAGAMEVVKKM